MLLNTASSHATPSGASTPAETSTAVARPVAAPPAPPSSGRALLAALEQLAQQELAMLVQAQVGAPVTPPPDRVLAGLAWDLGLSGDQIV